jgi:general secretion pathway protein B
MSFILDAIAKSEQERQQLEVPGIGVLALPAAGAQQPRRVLTYFIVGALLLNAALFVIWMQSGRPLLGSSAPTQTEEKDRGNIQLIVPSNITPSDSAISPEIPVQATIPEVVAKIEAIASMNEPLAEQQSAIPTETGEATTDLVRKPEMASPKPVGATTGEEIIAAQRIEPVQDLQDTVVIQRKVSSLSELPSAVRKDLPTMVFSGHLYSTNPASSFVFVDEGRTVTKGQEIVNELFLYEITPTGVIVEFRGYLVEVGVLQGWTLN